MTLFMNPGSGGIPVRGEGWTNTFAKARQTAEEWLDRMRAEGMRDIGLFPGARHLNGRWEFTFRHAVTGVKVTLECDGVDDMDAYVAERIFPPRIYWNGSSIGEPKLDDFAAEGFERVVTWKAV